MDLLAGIGKAGGLDDLLNGSKAGIESNLCTLRVTGYSQVKASCGLVPTTRLCLRISRQLTSGRQPLRYGIMEGLPVTRDRWGAQS